MTYEVDVMRNVRDALDLAMRVLRDNDLDTSMAGEFEILEDALYDANRFLGEECDEDEHDQFNSDAEADADVLASAGWGTDEDYGCYDSGSEDY
jgi:hypothetical protein